MLSFYFLTLATFIKYKQPALMNRWHEIRGYSLDQLSRVSINGHLDRQTIFVLQKKKKCFWASNLGFHKTWPRAGLGRQTNKSIWQGKCRNKVNFPHRSAAYFQCTEVHTSVHFNDTLCTLPWSALCSICTSEVLQDTEVLHCNATANAL